MTDKERLLMKCDADDKGCWVWYASRDHRGYGLFRYKRRLQPAHRVSYMLHTGEIPHGYHVDHLCRNRACVNPAHLEAVPYIVNLHRRPKVGPDKGTNSYKVGNPCIRGHLLTLETLATTRGGVHYCRVCRQAYDRKRYLKKKHANPHL